jgi:hypothetical protein
VVDVLRKINKSVVGVSGKKGKKDKEEELDIDNIFLRKNGLYNSTKTTGKEKERKKE